MGALNFTFKALSFNPKKEYKAVNEQNAPQKVQKRMDQLKDALFAIQQGCQHSFERRFENLNVSFF